MGFGFKRFLEGLNLVPSSSNTTSTMGDLQVTSADGKINYHNGTRSSPLLTEDTATNVVNVKDFGATGDGSTNDTAAINNAIASATNGGVIYFPPGIYKCTTSLTVAIAKIQLLGDGVASKIVFAADQGISISEDNCQISNLWIDGTNYNTGAHSGALIFASGADSSNYLDTFKVLNCLITNPTAYGIRVHFTNNVEIKHNIVDTIFYTGIEIESCNYTNVLDNIVKNILGNLAGNSYGITFSREVGVEATFPRCNFFNCSNNEISNNTTWEALDTHCGQNGVFSNNVIYNCKFGIVAGPASDGLAPQNISITDNILNSSVTNGSYQYGIALTGDPGVEKASGCVISNNSIIGYGDQSDDEGGAIYFYETGGLKISDNSFIEPSPYALAGIGIGNNLGLSITNNTVVDSFSNTVGVGEAGIARLRGDNYSGIISDNSLTTSSKVATYVATVGYRFDGSATGINLTIGNHQYTNPTSFIVNKPAGIFISNRNFFPQTYKSTSVPTTGTWKNGDIFFNEAPTSGQPIGWMCTVSGTPGTWVALADLSPGSLTLAAGSAANPSLKFDTNTGLYRQGSLGVGFSSNGVQTGFFDSSGNWVLGKNSSSGLYTRSKFLLLNFDGVSAAEVEIDNGVSNGNLALSGDSGPGAGGRIKLYGSTHATKSNRVEIFANGVTYTWPTSDGTSGQPMVTNGAGVLSFGAAATVVAARASAPTTSIINNTATNVVYPTETYDTNSAYNNATGIFTAPAGGAGKYSIKATARLVATSWNSGDVIEFYVYKNGAQYSIIDRHTIEAAVSNLFLVEGSDDVDLAVGETMNIVMFQNHGINLALDGNGFISIARYGG